MTDTTKVMERETTREMFERDFGYYQAVFSGTEQEIAAYKAVAFQWYCAGRRSVADQCRQVTAEALRRFDEMRERIHMGGE